MLKKITCLQHSSQEYQQIQMKIIDIITSRLVFPEICRKFTTLITSHCIICELKNYLLSYGSNINYKNDNRKQDYTSTSLLQFILYHKIKKKLHMVKFFLTLTLTISCVTMFKFYLLYNDSIMTHLCVIMSDKEVHLTDDK